MNVSLIEYYLFESFLDVAQQGNCEGDLLLADMGHRKPQLWETVLIGDNAVDVLFSLEVPSWKLRRSN